MRLAPLKRFVDPARSITYGIVQAGPDLAGGVPYIRPVDMTDDQGVIDASALRRTNPAIARRYKRSEILHGDVVVSIGPSFGKVMVVPPELSGANLTQGTARVASDRDVSARFIYWSLQAAPARQFWRAAVSGATLSALNLGTHSLTPIPGVGSRLQEAVADFLDRDTGRIDALVGK